MAWNSNLDLVKGSNMQLYIYLPDSAGTLSSGTSRVMAYAKSCSIQVDSDSIDTTSKLSCRWNSVMQGNASYSISSEALYCLKSSAEANSAYTIAHLFDCMHKGVNIGWIIGEDKADECGVIEGVDTTKPYWTGEAAIQSLSIEAGTSEIVSSSITLQGSGPLIAGGV